MVTHVRDLGYPLQDLGSLDPCSSVSGLKWLFGSILDNRSYLVACVVCYLTEVQTVKLWCSNRLAAFGAD